MQQMHKISRYKSGPLQQNDENDMLEMMALEFGNNYEVKFDNPGI